MTYGDYLRLDAILAAQAPLSDAHDELLFIIQHQTSELWMKLALHELHAARAWITAGRLAESQKSLTRVARIFEQLNGAWDVLRTMTPSDYTTFRDALGTSSGVQSHQYRMIEFILGNRQAAHLKVHAHKPEALKDLQDEMARLTLYQVALNAVCARLDPRIGFTEPQQEPARSSPGVERLWKMVYEAPRAHWDLYELAEKLVDIEDYFRRWRFNHVTTVERIIGLKHGTGGTSGVSYLRKMLEVELFPDLWIVRTTL